MNIPDTAIFCKEENGVKWYREQVDESNAINYMVFDEGIKLLQGSWVLPRAIFLALSDMTPEERAKPESHDEMMGAIREVLQKNYGLS